MVKIMKTNDLVKVALFAALTAILSQVIIPIGLVPISLGTFAVYMCAIFLNPKNAFLSQVIYLLLGVIGLPVFNNFGAGIGHLMGPTGGFAISYPFVALIASSFIYKSRSYDFKVKISLITTGFILATITCYVFGITWFTYVLDMSVSEALPIVAYPFIVPDSIKIVVAIIISYRVEKIYKI